MERQDRRLAAILAADVEGYSRLMGADEAGTLRCIAAYRAVIDGHVAAPIRAASSVARETAC